MDHLRNALRRYLADEPYRRLTDDELWARFRDHREEGAFRVFLEKTGGIVYALSKSVLGNDAEAEEAFQEAYCALFRHQAKLASYPAAVAWLLETAKNKARTHRRWRLRLTWRERRKAATTPTTTVETECSLAERERREAVVAALADLPSRERRAVELVYLAGMTHAEAAEALGWSRGTVGTYVQRGLERLRQAPGLREGTTGAVLTAALADVPGLPPERLAALADGLWERAGTAAASAGGWWLAGRPSLIVGLAVCTGLTTVGVLTVWPRPTPLPGPESPAVVTPTPAQVESVPDRNLRVFRQEIQPKLLAALQPLAFGNGDVVLESVETYDTRVDCRITLRHRLASAPNWATRLRIIRCAGGGTWVLADLNSTGRYEVVSPHRPIVWWRNPLTGGEIVSRPQALTEALAAFGALPNDERVTAEIADYSPRMLAALKRHEGLWYPRGDASRRYRIIAESDIVMILHGRQQQVLANWHFGLNREGVIYGFGIIEGTMAIFAPDGQRIDFPETGEWWSREPLPTRK